MSLGGVPRSVSEARINHSTSLHTAEDVRYCTLIVPTGSALHFAGQDETSAALFEGVLTITGTWCIGWNDDTGLAVTFKPDAETRLPYWREGMPASAIGLENPDALAQRVLTAKARTRLRGRSGISVYGRAVIRVDQIRTALVATGTMTQARFRDIMAPGNT